MFFRKIVSLIIFVAFVILFSPPSFVSAHTDPFTFGLQINIGDEEIEQTVVASLDLLDALMKIDRKEKDILDSKEAEKAGAAINDFFKDKNPLKIDGIQVKPILKEVKFVPIDPKLAEEIRKAGKIIPPKGDVHIIFSYATKGKPKQVSIQWDLFPAELLIDPKYKEKATASWKEAAAALTAYDEERIIIFTKEEPEFIWYNQGGGVKTSLRAQKVSEKKAGFTPLFFLSFALLLPIIFPLLKFLESKKYPLILTPLIICLLSLSLYFVNQLNIPYLSEESLNSPDAQEAQAIFETLHKNIYRAFDYKTESDIYDALAQSVDGMLLDEVYNEIYQSLIMREEGGAFARVQSVKILNSKLEETNPEEKTRALFKISAHWQVSGAVSHWGHIHSRLNEYKARYTIEPKGKNWKITGVEILDQKRVTR